MCTKGEKGEESLGKRVIAPYMCSSDLDRVDASDGVQEIVCFIYDDNVPLQFDPDCLTGWAMEESVVGKNYKLGGRGRLVLMEESKQTNFIVIRANHIINTD